MSEAFNTTKNERKISIVYSGKSHVYDSIAFSGFNIFTDFEIPKFLLSKNPFPRAGRILNNTRNKKGLKDQLEKRSRAVFLRDFLELRIFLVFIFGFESIIKFNVWLFRRLDLEFCNLTLYQLSSAFE